MAQLPISNVINVSAVTSQTGVGAYNTSNLALFTRDVPNASFGSLGYAIYLNPSQVATDFGSSSTTYQMANAIFSQQPNILANGGYLTVIPFLTAAQTAVQTISFSGVSASGTFVLNYNSNPTASINWNDNAAAIQSKLQAVSGLSSVTVSGSIASQSLVVTFTGVSGAASLLTVTSNSLLDASSVAITVTPVTTTIGSTHETLDKAITRTSGLVQYFGIMSAEIEIQSVMLAAASVVQALNKMVLFTSFTTADVNPGGLLDLLRTGSFTQSRAVPYFETNVSNQPLTSLEYMAAYAGRAFSTNFGGSNTTQTMHLKNLAGIQPDPSMTQTLLNSCQAAGADVYVSLQGVSCVFTSGANSFFDEVYNLQAFVGALQVAGFNYLAGTATKIPQTESGMDGLKGAYRAVCEQFRTNQYVAPGSWNSGTTFGNLQNFLSNISQVGYYIYSSPISSQSQAARVARQAPLVQIAVKEAGAEQSSNVIVYVNA